MSPIEKQKEAELEFKKIAWAYEVLSSSTKRATFENMERTSNPFDFASYWEEWGSKSWANFWDTDEGRDKKNKQTNPLHNVIHKF